MLLHLRGDFKSSVSFSTPSIPLSVAIFLSLLSVYLSVFLCLFLPLILCYVLLKCHYLNIQLKMVSNPYTEELRIPLAGAYIRTDKWKYKQNLH